MKIEEEQDTSCHREHHSTMSPCGVENVQTSEGSQKIRSSVPTICLPSPELDQSPSIKRIKDDNSSNDSITVQEPFNGPSITGHPPPKTRSSTVNSEGICETVSGGRSLTPKFENRTNQMIRDDSYSHGNLASMPLGTSSSSTAILLQEECGPSSSVVQECKAIFSPKSATLMTGGEGTSSTASMCSPVDSTPVRSEGGSVDRTLEEPGDNELYTSEWNDTCRNEEGIKSSESGKELRTVFSLQHLGSRDTFDSNCILQKTGREQEPQDMDGMEGERGDRVHDDKRESVSYRDEAYTSGSEQKVDQCMENIPAALNGGSYGLASEQPGENSRVSNIKIAWTEDPGRASKNELLEESTPRCFTLHDSDSDDDHFIPVQHDECETPQSSKGNLQLEQDMNDDTDALDYHLDDLNERMKALLTMVPISPTQCVGSSSLTQTDEIGFAKKLLIPIVSLHSQSSSLVPPNMKLLEEQPNCPGAPKSTPREFHFIGTPSNVETRQNPAPESLLEMVPETRPSVVMSGLRLDNMPPLSSSVEATLRDENRLLREKLALYETTTTSNPSNSPMGDEQEQTMHRITNIFCQFVENNSQGLTPRVSTELNSHMSRLKQALTPRDENNSDPEVLRLKRELAVSKKFQQGIMDELKEMKKRLIKVTEDNNRLRRERLEKEQAENRPSLIKTVASLWKKN